MSYSQLWVSVAIVAQMRKLPAPVAKALSVSKHKVLVAIRDENAKRKLAEKAAAEKWTVRKLESEVAKHRKREPRRGGGRPAIPEHLKALRRLPKVVAPLTEVKITANDVELLGEDRIEELQEALQEQLATLSAANDEIAEALEEFRKRE